jgi:hypothetical protein
MTTPNPVDALMKLVEATKAIIECDDAAKSAHGNPNANLNGYGLVDLFDCVGHHLGAGPHKQQPYRSNSLNAALEDARAAVEASARALAAAPAPSELQESVRWKQLVHMVERGVTPEILVDWINHPNRLDYAAKLRAEHG